MVHVTLILGKSECTLSYPLHTQCVCLCVCSPYWLSLSGFWSSDDRRMVFLKFLRKTSPQAHLDTKGAVTLCFSDLTVCSFKYVCVCAVGGRGLVCACVNASVCWSCHLFLVLCMSPVSGRAFDLFDRRFLQCEIAPARFTQWKSRP